MDLIHFIVFACIVYIAIVLGRMSMKNDMRRRFASIEEGIELPNVTAVINYILKLRDLSAKLEHDYHAANNSFNIANATVEKLERDYKTLMEQMKEKREECDAFEKKIETYKNEMKEKNAQMIKFAKIFDSWMAELWEEVTAINENSCSTFDKLSAYTKSMYNNKRKRIYATRLVNNTCLLTLGDIEVMSNGKVKYSEGSRSLGNIASKENQEWRETIINTDIDKLKPRESSPVAIVFNYEEYLKSTSLYIELEKKLDLVIKKSAGTLRYMEGIRQNYEEIKKGL